MRYLQLLFYFESFERFRSFYNLENRIQSIKLKNRKCIKLQKCFWYQLSIFHQKKILTIMDYMKQGLLILSSFVYSARSAEKWEQMDFCSCFFLAMTPESQERQSLSPFDSSAYVDRRQVCCTIQLGRSAVHREPGT